MNELITEIQAEWLVAICAALLLLSGLIAFAAGRDNLRKRIGPRMMSLWLLAGPLLYGLWRLDALLIRWLGFDTLLRLGVEIGIFVMLGLVIGLWLRGDRRISEPDHPAAEE